MCRPCDFRYAVATRKKQIRIANRVKMYILFKCYCFEFALFSFFCAILIRNGIKSQFTSFSSIFFLKVVKDVRITIKKSFTFLNHKTNRKKENLQVELNCRRNCTIFFSSHHSIASSKMRMNVRYVTVDNFLFLNETISHSSVSL